VGEIDRSEELWRYVPGSYKTEQYVGKIEFFLGKAEQDLIAPYLEGKKPGEAVFSYRAYLEEKRIARRATRKTKVQPSQVARDKRNRERRKPPEFFDRISYRLAVRYGIAAARRAGVEIPYWTPYRIRNSTATKIEIQYGDKEAQAQLGHKSVNMTKRYSKAAAVLREQLARERVNPFALGTDPAESDSPSE